MVESANTKPEITVGLDPSPNAPYTQLKTAQITNAYLENLNTSLEADAWSAFRRTIS
jgi:hypothetical protein